MGIVDTITGAADNAAGSVDESIGRQFDDTPGGGLIDGYQSYAGEVYDPVTDGAVTRQFDDTPGGGLVDGAQQTAGDAADAAADAAGDATDLLPDWAGPVAIVAVVAVVLIAARPLLGITEEVVA
jgi:uncharacterized protein YjbJ (UPF0337 family)